MRTLGTIAAMTLLLAAGCDDGRGGGTDAGGITLMDAGPGMMGTDAGPGMMMGTDAGPGMMGGCSITGSGFPPLPATCLPRCSASTADAVNMCGDAECQNMALDADGTPPVNANVGGMSTTIDCAGCFNWQINSCIFDACPMQFGECVMCGSMGCVGDAMCSAEEMTLNSCIMTNMTGIQSCVNMRASMCFGATSGFLPDFGSSQRQFEMTPEILRHVVSLYEAHLGLN